MSVGVVVEEMHVVSEDSGMRQFYLLAGAPSGVPESLVVVYLVKTELDGVWGKGGRWCLKAADG